MNKLTITRGNTNKEIWIEKVKYIIGSNYDYKYELIRDLKQFVNHNFSDHSECSNGICKMTINDHPVNYRKVNLYEVNHYWDLASDMKLGTKSIILKWLETKLKDQEYCDLINTLNYSLHMLSDELNADNDLFNITSNDCNNKLLAKLLIPKLIGFTDEAMNAYDYTYKDYILLQLKIIKGILNQSLETNIVIIDLRKYDISIINQIKQLNNAYCLVVFDGMLNEKQEDMLLCQKKIIDLADKESLYDLLNNNLNTNFSLKEIDEIMKKYIDGIQDRDTDLIDKLLK